MRIISLVLWAMPFSLAQAAATGMRNGYRHMGKRQESLNSSATQVSADKFEGLRISYITTTTTEKVQVTVAAEPLTVIQMVTPAAEPATVTVTVKVAQPLIVTELVPIAGAAVTVTETVTGTCAAPANTPGGTESVPAQNGVGVSVLPIAASALPTTTFSADPFATETPSVSTPSASEASTSSSSSSPSSSAISVPSASASTPSNPPVASTTSASTTSASTTSQQTTTSETTSETTTTQTTTSTQTTNLAPSVNLGGLEPNSSDFQSVQETATAEAPVNTGARVKVPSLGLSSVLTLGNLVAATAGLEARATQAA